MTGLYRFSTMKAKAIILTLLVAVAASSVLTYVFLKPAPEIRYEYVEVPSGTIELPDIDLSWVESLWRRTLDRRQRAVEREGAKTEVIEFCRPLVDRKSDITDGGTQIIEIPPVPEPDVRAVIAGVKIDDPWNPLARRKVEVQGYLNTGDLYSDLFIAGASGDLEIGVEGADSFVQDSRWGWLQPIVTHGLTALAAIAPFLLF